MTTTFPTTAPAAIPATPKAYWEKCLLVLAVVAFATFNPLLLALYLALAVTLVLVRIETFRCIPSADASVFVGVATIMTLCLAFAAYSSPTAIYHYIVGIISLALAAVMTRDPARYVSASMFALFAAQSAILLFLAFSGIRDFPLERMIPSTSSNAITSLLIVLQFNYSVSRYLVARKSSIVTAGVTLAICVIGYGRGSILSAAALFAIVALYSFPASKTSTSTKWMIAGAAAILSAVVLPWLAQFIIANTKIASGLLDVPRISMIVGYLGQIDGWTLIAGAPYDGTIIESVYNGNPHNAFIRAHHILGLPYLIAMLLLPAYLWFNQRGVAIKLYILGMFVVLFFRAFTEPVLFPTIFDLLYFSVCIGLARVSSPVQQPTINGATRQFLLGKMASSSAP